MEAQQFAEIIERFARRDLSVAEWKSFFVTHYRDLTIEEARRQVVEIAILSKGELTPHRLAELREIASSLRPL